MGHLSLHCALVSDTAAFWNIFLTASKKMDRQFCEFTCRKDFVVCFASTACMAGIIYAGIVMADSQV